MMSAKSDEETEFTITSPDSSVMVRGNTRAVQHVAQHLSLSPSLPPSPSPSLSPSLSPFLSLPPSLSLFPSLSASLSACLTGAGCEEGEEEYVGTECVELQLDCQQDRPHSSVQSSRRILQLCMSNVFFPFPPFSSLFYYHLKVTIICR